MEQITREEMIELLKDGELLAEVTGNIDLARRYGPAIASLQAAEPVAVLCQQIDAEAQRQETSWFEHEPLHPKSRLHKHRSESKGWETLEAFALPCPPAKVEGEVVITSDPATGQCVAVTRQDEEGQILSVIWERPAKAQADLVWCGCGDGYPDDSYGAAYIDIFGHCENCHMGSGTADPAAQVESWAGGFRINPMGNIERLRDGMFLYSCPNLPYEAQGWKLVPIEPTPDMTLQGALAGVEHGNGEFSQIGAEAVYKAMLTASPAPDHSGDELVRDAERYRWLRNRRHSDIEVIGPHGDEDEQFLYEEELDEAIDAQRQQEEAER